MPPSVVPFVPWGSAAPAPAPATRNYRNRNTNTSGPRRQLPHPTRNLFCLDRSSVRADKLGLAFKLPISVPRRATPPRPFPPTTQPRTQAAFLDHTDTQIMDMLFKFYGIELVSFAVTYETPIIGHMRQPSSPVPAVLLVAKGEASFDQWKAAVKIAYHLLAQEVVEDRKISVCEWDSGVVLEQKNEARIQVCKVYMAKSLMGMC